MKGRGEYHGGCWVAVALAAAIPACDFGKPLEASGSDAAGLGGGAGSGGSSDAAAEAVVVIKNLAFEPSEIHVAPGTTVRWVMEDPGTFHFVVQGLPGGSSPLFSSPKLVPGNEYKYTFTEPGTYVYYCSNHSNVMRDAKVVVE